MELFSFVWDVVKTLFSPITRVLKWFYEQLPFKIVRRKPIAKLGIIESSWRGHTWEYTKHKDKNVIIINTHWQITNTLPYSLTALNVFLIKPERVKGSVMIRNYKADIWGYYPIPQGHTTEVDASFLIDRKHIKNPRDVIRAEIELQDPTGRTHKISDIIVKPIRRSVPKKETLVIENPSKIRCKIEKQVVAVLKNEIKQYKVRGRREGRLGTVEWPKGGIEWRDADAKIKFLYENSNMNNVKSEHIDALLNLYKSTSSQGKAKIISSLLKRIDRKTEYRDVGYLIIFFLFEVGHLKDGLDIALKKLQYDKANGFSDVLKILDFLLAFRYQEFETTELDVIETFVCSTKEYPFQIKERINAIRVRRMINKPSIKVTNNKQTEPLKVESI